MVKVISEFQSTRPRGARPRSSLSLSITSLVSIHAPARGATWRLLRGCRTCTSFNPRARAGRDLATRAGIFLAGLFQSTRPRGARRELA